MADLPLLWQIVVTGLIILGALNKNHSLTLSITVQLIFQVVLLLTLHCIVELLPLLYYKIVLLTSTVS